MEKTISTDKARQGKKGVPVLKVLIGALVLVAIVWGGLEIWGSNIAPPDSNANGSAATGTTTAP